MEAGKGIIGRVPEGFVLDCVARGHRLDVIGRIIMISPLDGHYVGSGKISALVDIERKIDAEVDCLDEICY